ncbi:hypothetical protein, partial [Streptomyces sp. NPDC006333]|uniref:hypothetical protein n=1 Tax=Streptomyces sp. NPDC006333 TaxID=3156753 RepID=UPI0033AF9E1A
MRAPLTCRSPLSGSERCCPVVVRLHPTTRKAPGMSEEPKQTRISRRNALGLFGATVSGAAAG